MVTGAALATTNRVPVLLFPSDQFATRVPDPVLQQVEDPTTLDVTVNDAFRPVSRFFDRINRPEQLIPSLLNAMRVLTDPAETGAVAIAMPQDVQAEALDWPVEFFGKRVWHVRRPLPEPAALERAVALIRAAERPTIIAGGGTIYSEACEELRALATATGIPVADTQAGKGAINYDHPCSMGGVGSTGGDSGNHIADRADLVIGVGTRYSDFTTASKTQFKNPDVRFVNINITPFDAAKESARDGRGRRARGPDRFERGAGRTTASSDDLLPRDRRRARGLVRDHRPLLPPGPRSAARPDGGLRRAQRTHGCGRHCHQRRRLHARRPAGAVAGQNPRPVPRGVRLLLHGLRDPRRPGLSSSPDRSPRSYPSSGTAPTRCCPWSWPRSSRRTSRSSTYSCRTTASAPSERSRSLTVPSASAPRTVSAASAPTWRTPSRSGALTSLPTPSPGGSTVYGSHASRSSGGLRPGAGR